MPKYNVEFSGIFTFHTQVEGKDEDEAYELAVTELHSGTGNFEFDQQDHDMYQVRE